jgi:hypothetical protein
MSWNEVLGIVLLISTIFGVWYGNKAANDGKEHPFL